MTLIKIVSQLCQLFCQFVIDNCSSLFKVIKFPIIPRYALFSYCSCYINTVIISIIFDNAYVYVRLTYCWLKLWFAIENIVSCMNRSWHLYYGHSVMKWSGKYSENYVSKSLRSKCGTFIWFTLYRLWFDVKEVSLHVGYQQFLYSFNYDWKLNQCTYF